MSAYESLFEREPPTSILDSGVRTAVILGVLTVFYFLSVREITPLRNIPGPFWASFTSLWIFLKSKSLKRPLVDIALHKKYGPIVRIGPKEVLVSSPESFRTIYGAGSHFRKAEWYVATSDCGIRGPDTLDMLNEQNMEKYRAQRRSLGPAFTAKAVKDYEKNLDAALLKDIQIMRERQGQSTDLDIFLNMFASDCLASAAFSTSKNMVESGKDDGSIATIHLAWKYMHTMGYFPRLHRIIVWSSHYIGTVAMQHLSNWVGVLIPWVVVDRERIDITGPFSFPIKQLSVRMADETRKPRSASEDPHPPDIIAKLLQLQLERDGLKGKDHWIKGMAVTIFGAGVETTAITVGALIDNILNHAGCQRRIHEEIDTAKREGKLSSRVPGLKDMQDQLPYMYACMKESMRLHAVIGMSLMRTVPQGGVELEGKWLPTGTTVGINPWVFGRTKSLYGEDAEEWRPERWLEFSPEKLRSLETYNIYFGGTGARSCLGKYLAQSIFLKMIPMLFDHFEWSYTDPSKERILSSAFGTRWCEMMVQWKARQMSSEKSV